MEHPISGVSSIYLRKENGRKYMRVLDYYERHHDDGTPLTDAELRARGISVGYRRRGNQREDEEGSVGPLSGGIADRNRWIPPNLRR